MVNCYLFANIDMWLLTVPIILLFSVFILLVLFLHYVSVQSRCPLGRPQSDDGNIKLSKRIVILWKAKFMRDHVSELHFSKQEQTVLNTFAVNQFHYDNA